MTDQVVVSAGVSDGGTEGLHPPDARRRRSRLPLLLPLLVLSVLALGAVTFQLPYYTIGPGPAQPVAALIDIPAEHSFPQKGQFLLTSVSLRDVTVLAAVRGWADPDVDVVRARKIIGAEPTKQTRRQFDTQLTRTMTFSRETAVEVAFRRLGIPVPEPQPGSPPVAPPFDVKIDTGRVGGASGGLALTLGLLDILTSGELTGGHNIAVSGTILFEGTVGDVDGIAQKTAAARASGATHMLVAPRNHAEALAHAGPRLQVLQVANLDQALAALAAIGGELGTLRQPPPG